MPKQRGPTKKERAAFLAALEQDKTGLQDPLLSLAATAAPGVGMGNKWLSALSILQEMSGNKGGAADIAEILASKKKVPMWLVKWLAKIPEEEMAEVIKKSWEKLGGGGSRDAYRHRGVVAKIPHKSLDYPAFSGSNQLDNLNEYIELVKHVPQKRSDVLFPRPYAYATNPGVSFQQYFPLKRYGKDYAENVAPLWPKVEALANKAGIQDVSIIKGDRYMGDIAHNWGTIEKNPKKAVLFDLGMQERSKTDAIKRALDFLGSHKKDISSDFGDFIASYGFR